jgi:antitoxin (DNA-binding transcriptional repressor) of toxin-antitoxin stability system
MYSLSYMIDRPVPLAVQERDIMKEVSVAELRQNAKACLDLVLAGETVRVRRHGHPVADLVPVTETAPAWRHPATPLTIPGLALSAEIRRDRDATR